VVRGGGFAIRSTWRRLRHFFQAFRTKNAGGAFRETGYLDPEREALPNQCFGEEIFWKSDWFSDETEIRLTEGEIPGAVIKETMDRINAGPRGKWIPCDLNLLIQEIVINPSASPDRKRRLRDVAERFCRVLLPRLRESDIWRLEQRCASADAKPSVC
jgi:hypothetical protein